MATDAIKGYAKQKEDKIDSYIKAASDDYKTREESMSDIDKMPKEVFVLGQTSKRELFKGGFEEMKNTQSSNKESIEKEIREADLKLQGLKGNSDNIPDIVFLTAKLQDWMDKIKQLSIYGNEYHGELLCKAGDAVMDTVLKWQNYCNESSEAKRFRFNEKSNGLRKDIEQLETSASVRSARLVQLKDEKTDYENHKMKYEAHSEQEKAEKMRIFDNELRYIREDLDDLMFLEESLKEQLESKGYFDKKHKKSLTERLSKASENVRTKQQILDAASSRIEAEKEKIRKTNDRADRYAELCKGVAIYI